MSAMWTPRDLAGVTGGQWHGPPANAEIERVTYVLSGDAGPSPGALMVLTDEADWPSRRRTRSGQAKHDPYQVARIAAELGASAIMTSTRLTDPPLPMLQVDDSRRALWDLAYEARRRYAGRVIGITGTAGKSTTKGMLRHVLRHQASVSATISNWNTLDSVAMTMGSVLSSDLAVIEIAQSGMAPSKEVSAATFVRPHCAIITSIGIGEVHMFPTIDDTARAKTDLFRNLEPGGIAIFNRDTNRAEYLLDVARKHAGHILTFGQHPSADVRLIEWNLKDKGCLVDIDMTGERVEFVLPAPGRGIALNALATIAACQAMGLDWRRAIEDLASVPVGSRVLSFHRVRVPGGRAVLIDDSHNATELSMVAAFEVLQRVGDANARRIAALGHIVNLYDAAAETHARLAKPLMECGVDLVFTTGEGMSGLRSQLPERMRGPHLDTPEELAAAVLAELRPGDVVLAKGSHRDTGFRRVAKMIRAGRAGTTRQD